MVADRSFSFSTVTLMHNHHVRNRRRHAFHVRLSLVSKRYNHLFTQMVFSFGVYMHGFVDASNNYAIASCI